MPIHHEWDNPERTIIRISYEGRWSWDEYFASARQVYVEIAEQPHRVDVIADMRTSSLPVGGSALSSASAALRNRPANNGLLVIVTNHFIKVMLDIFKQMNTEMRTMMFGAKSLDEAYQIIEKQQEM